MSHSSFTAFSLERGQNIHTLFGFTEEGQKFTLSECADLGIAENILELLNRELRGVVLDGLCLPDQTPEYVSTIH